MKMKWDEPPVEKKGRRPNDKRKLDREVGALRRNPNRWALMREDASSGAYIVYKKRGCTTRTESLGKNRYAIWAKWDPSSDEAKAWMARYRPDELEEMGVDVPDDHEYEEDADE